MDGWMDGWMDDSEWESCNMQLFGLSKNRKVKPRIGKRTRYTASTFRKYNNITTAGKAL